MHIIEKYFGEVLLIGIEKYKDSRGYFTESYNKLELKKILKKEINFVQDNHSFSKKNILIKVPVNAKIKTQIKIIRPEDSSRVIKHTGAYDPNIK